MLDPLHVDLGLSALSQQMQRPVSLRKALIATSSLQEVELEAAAMELIVADCLQGDSSLGQSFERVLRTWDMRTEGRWVTASGTAPSSEARRAAVYAALELTQSERDVCNTHFGVIPADPPVVIAEEHADWYTTERRSPSFYWDAYSNNLRKNGWPEVSLQQLDQTTAAVVSRLTDPESAKVWQSKGLVVGYVQSGKTANFTGVIARAADAGYRLIIVLGGTLNLLRAQTQRRLDKELLGKEQVGQDYLDDSEWESFVSYGAPPSKLGAYDWRRHTGPGDDYQRLAYGLQALEFERAEPSLPLNHPKNLRRMAARLVVIKKIPEVLERFAADLRKLQSSLSDVPALVIDDESDQASINTKKANPDAQDQARTATNKAIVDLLKILPRAQYVGYTATPFANVLVDPADAEDLFPRDFIVSLPRPDGYMGVADFFDGIDEDLPDFQSKERAFLRDVEGEDTEAENLQRAIDAFVLTGALKLYRQSVMPRLRFRHHTMLVHRSHKMDEHRGDADLARRLYLNGDYSGKGYDRLLELWEKDVLPVSRAQDPGMRQPASFDDLQPYLGQCLKAIGRDQNSVMIVNSESDELPDFDRKGQWKILVGGTKLSRGYTIEGLTVSYYRRRVGQADTMMQMGRWFGFRRGYRDLVRLFIGTDESGTNLREQFKRLCVIEEEFRSTLRMYSSEGGERLTPKKVPPLVPGEIQGLLPTARNKMFNAELKGINLGGRSANPTEAPRSQKDRTANLKLAKSLLAAAEKPTEQRLGFDDTQQWRGLVASVAQAEVVRFLVGYKWPVTPSPVRHVLTFLEGAVGAPGVDRWLIVAPMTEAKDDKGNDGGLSLGGWTLPVRRRKRASDERFGVYTEPKHVQVAQFLAGHDVSSSKAKSGRGEMPTAALSKLLVPKTAVILLYLVQPTPSKAADKSALEEGDPSVGVALYFPPNKLPQRLLWSVRDASQPNAIVVPTQT